MNLDINHLVRSAAIAAVPSSCSFYEWINPPPAVAEASSEESRVQQVYNEYGDQLAEACIGWAVSKVDTKLERESKNTIDEVFGGEVDYAKVCNAFVF